ncbi:MULTISPECIES: hypothetical protein [unclassified Streptomyces]|uniref:hypothetical protein n=1 Tax=unclassified Streptomyces TaxID=2593676 RepID=UPI0003601711|nr:MULTISPECIES: hypothetical protein [unclassified Streptomyces]MYT30845.1 hypothetical protein [Streptomyces sp. SID8354]
MCSLDERTKRAAAGRAPIAQGRAPAGNRRSVGAGIGGGALVVRPHGGNSFG